jgi:hypothetical protein
MLGLLLFLLRNKRLLVGDPTVFVLVLMVVFFFMRGVMVRVSNCNNFVEEGVEIGPIVRILLGEDELPLVGDFEGSNMGKDDILVGVGVNILIFCNFEGDEVWRYHIADNFQVG